MTERRRVERVLEDLDRFLADARDPPLRILDERAVPGGREITITDGSDSATLVARDDGSIDIRGGGPTLRARLQKWETRGSGGAGSG